MVCEQGHSHDRAKQGYFNLLLANQKRSKQPGDDKAMVTARQKFLQAGHYRALTTQLSQSFEQSSDADGPSHWLDIGCGEGFYLRHLAATNLNVQWYGLDISKEAIKLSAKQSSGRSLPSSEQSSDSSGQFVVASSFRIPVNDSTVDGVLQVFAPGSIDEISRILKPHGIWIRVAPGPSHLENIKRQLYTQVKPHTSPEVPKGFTLASEDRVQSSLTIEDSETLSHLIDMTPFSWQGDPAQRTHLKSQSQFDEHLDFIIQRLQKTASI